MEALQQLKFAFRTEPMNFMEGQLMEEDELATPRRLSRHTASKLLASLSNAGNKREKEDAMDVIMRSGGGE